MTVTKKKIHSNFLMISNYNNNISWIPEYTDNYIIYDQSAAAIYPPKLDRTKVIQSAHLGHNIRDYCSFIIDHYENLPEVTIFATGNVFPRHVSRDAFDSIVNEQQFTPIKDTPRYRVSLPDSFIDDNDMYNEANKNWYINENHPTKYFHTYNDFLKFCFREPNLPVFITFVPGANYVVPKEHIKMYPRVFYENLRTFVSHCSTAIPGESHIIERALYSIWRERLTLTKEMQKPVNDATFPFITRTKTPLYVAILHKVMLKFTRLQSRLLRANDDYQNKS